MSDRRLLDDWSRLNSGFGAGGTENEVAEEGEEEQLLHLVSRPPPRPLYTDRGFFFLGQRLRLTVPPLNRPPIVVKQPAATLRVVRADTGEERALETGETPVKGQTVFFVSSPFP